MRALPQFNLVGGGRWFRDCLRVVEEETDKESKTFTSGRTHRGAAETVCPRRLFSYAKFILSANV